MAIQVLPSHVFTCGLYTLYGLGSVCSLPFVVADLFFELKNQESIAHLPRNFSQIAPHLSDLFIVIQRIFLLAVTIEFVRNQLPSIPNHYGSQFEIGLTLGSTSLALDQKILDWTEALNQASGDYTALKNEVAQQCKELTDLLKKIRSQSIFRTSQGQLDSLKTLRDKLDPVLVKLASMDLLEEDKVEDEENHVPFMKLSLLGFRDHDWTSVARQMGWDPEDSIFLPLKLAEMKIFSINDLREKQVLDKEYPLTDQRVSALIQVLKGQVVSHVTNPKWEALKKVVYKIDRVVARIFAIAFHALVILTNFYTGFNYSREVLLYAIDDGWLGIYSRQSASMFVEGDIVSRCIWIFNACSPVYTLANATTYALKYHGFRSIPKILFETYFS